MIDLAKFSVEQLKSLRTEIAGELAKRAGEHIDLRYEAAPQGGAMFYDRPAAGGDYNRDLWFPTLEAANAHLVGLSSGLPVSVREDGTMYCDYTARGHSQSDMETRLVTPPQAPSEPVAARSCSHCGVITPRDNAQCYRCGLEEPRDRQIAFDLGCLYQPNAVELSTGVIVFDACGKCERCDKHGLTEGATVKDGAVLRKATDTEVARQFAAVNGEPHGTEPQSAP